MSELEYTPEELKEISVYFQRLESLKAEPEPTELDLFLKENPFVCSKCNTVLVSDALIDTMKDYGVILLSSLEDVLVGWSCPHCNGLTTNLSRLSVENSTWLVSKFNSAMAFTYPEGLCYRSFPYRFMGHERMSAKAPPRFVEKDIVTFSYRDFYDEFDPAAPPAYCSYAEGSPALGPAVSIWWYGIKGINSLLALENDTHLRAFPRYVPYHPFYNILDGFCTVYRVAPELLRETHESHAWLKNFPMSDLFWGVDKKRANKNFEFMKILDTVSRSDLLNSLPSGGRAAHNSSPGSVIPAIPELDLQGGWPLHRLNDLSNELWSALNDKWLQSVLAVVADEFIEKHLSSSGRTTCTLSDLWGLKASFLEKVAEKLSFPRQAAKEANILKREKIAAAEEKYDKLKAIISQNDIVLDRKAFILERAPHPEVKSFLILGKHGTGKELFAQAIHQISGAKKIKIVLCGDTSYDLFACKIFGQVKGAFTGADRTVPGALANVDGGTVFFDEIGNLPLSSQDMLLRLLEQYEYSPVGSNETYHFPGKLIFATNKPIAEWTKDGRFMPDLYQRMKIFKIMVPPLNDRKEDIPLLVEHFLQKRKKQLGIHGLKASKSFIRYLKSSDWEEGNVRELDNLIYEIVASRLASKDESEISEQDLSEISPSAIPAQKKKIKRPPRPPEEKRAEALLACKGNKSKAARMIGMSRAGYYR